MVLQENSDGQAEIPQSRNRLYEGTKKVIVTVYEAIAGLFKEDPKLRAIVDKYLTKELIDKFVEEHRRMVRERREGSYYHEDDAIKEIQQEVVRNQIMQILISIRQALQRFLHVMKAHGTGTGEDMFRIVWKEVVPQELKDLPQPFYSEVVTRLSRECGLRTA